MSDVFISYARSTAPQAQAVAEALRGLGYGVWLDDELPVHRTYSHVIEEQLTAAKAALVIWSAEAVKSEWVLSEANRAREDHKLVQLTVDGARLPMPFDQTQCADLAGWSGDPDAPGWRKVLSSIGDLVGGPASPPTAAPLALPSKPSIAVLPFANLSGDPDQDYFADGMVEEISAALTRFKSIFVIASGSSLSFKGKAVSPQEAARKLGVRYVLEGSVRKAGGRVRIAVKLVDGDDGAQLWSDRFEDTLEDVFALQDRVALAVAGRIEPTVQVAEIRRASARPTENLGSYELYLRALPLMRTYTKAGLTGALELLDRAIALDPDFGQALSLASSCYYAVDAFGWSADPEHTRRRGIEVTHRALRAARDDAQVLASAAGPLIYFESDLDAAIALVARAIALNPGSARAWLYSGFVHMRTGDVDVAVEHVETAMRLDPMGPNRPLQLLILGWARFRERRFAETISLLREVVQQTDHPGGHVYLAASYGHLGQTDAALEALSRYRTLTQTPFNDVAEQWPRDPTHQKLFLDGIALAEGKPLAEIEGGA